MAKKVSTHNLSTPLNSANTASFEINSGTGNLVIDSLSRSDRLLASGELEYLEKQEPPSWTVEEKDGKVLTRLKASGGRKNGLRMPWASCNGETNWQIHLNPAVSSDITAHSGGGNVRLDLTGMDISRISADTGGGNMDVILPDNAVIQSVTVKSGAGNVTIRLPAGLTARIHAATGLGKVIVDPRFVQIDKNTYQSPDDTGGTNKVEILANSGAGNVSVITI